MVTTFLLIQFFTSIPSPPSGHKVAGSNLAVHVTTAALSCEFNNPKAGSESSSSGGRVGDMPLRAHAHQGNRAAPEHFFGGRAEQGIRNENKSKAYATPQVRGESS
jgi:hypothetical protein